MGIAIMLVGVLYWAGWQILLPKVFGYKLVPRKETLEDGTVITLVRCTRSQASGSANKGVISSRARR